MLSYAKNLLSRTRLLTDDTKELARLISLCFDSDFNEGTIEEGTNAGDFGMRIPDKP